MTTLKTIFRTSAILGLAASLGACAGYDRFGNARVNPGALAVGALAIGITGYAIGQANAPRPAPQPNPYYGGYAQPRYQEPVDCRSIHVQQEYRGYGRESGYVLGNNKILSEHSNIADAYRKANELRNQCYNGGLLISEPPYEEKKTPEAPLVAVVPTI